MEKLNSGLMSIPVKMLARDLKKVECGSHDLPLGKQWQNGKEVKSSERPINAVFLVLRHHLGEFNNKDADVFIQTCYPIIVTNKIKKEHKKKDKGNLHS